MFRKLCLAVFLVGFLAALPAAAAELKIGIVDFQKILMESKSGKKIDADLKKERQRMESDFEVKKKELDDLKKKLERESMVMSREMREEKEIELRVKLKGAQDLEKQYRQELMKQEQSEVKQLQQEVLEIVEELGKKEKFTFITSKLGVLYADSAIDLTDRVIKVLDGRSK